MRQERGSTPLGKYDELLAYLLTVYTGDDSCTMKFEVRDAKDREGTYRARGTLYVETEMLEGLGEDAQAMTLAYSLKNALLGMRCSEEGSLKEALSSAKHFRDVSVFKEEPQPSIFRFCSPFGSGLLEGDPEGSLHFATILLPAAGYSVGQALADYDNKGIPIDIEVMNLLRQQADLSEEERLKRDKVYLRILERKLNHDYKVRLLNNHPTFQKTCQVLSWYFGEDVCVVDVPQSQKDAFDNDFQNGEQKRCGRFFSLSLEICQPDGVKDGVKGMTDGQVGFALIQSVIRAKMGKKHITLTSPKGILTEENEALVHIAHKCGYSLPDILVDCLKGGFCFPKSAMRILQAIMILDISGDEEFHKAKNLACALTNQKVPPRSVGGQRTDDPAGIIRKEHGQK